MRRIMLALVALVASCGGAPVELPMLADAHVTTDSSIVVVDASHDAELDAGTDAGHALDAGLEHDAGHDAGHACECTDGPCCDGCHVRPSSHVCLDDGPVRAVCSTRPFPGPSCGGSDRITVYLGDRYCDGIRPSCSGRIVEGASSVSDRCTYDAVEWDWVTCRTDSSDLGATCARWCG